MLLHPSLCILNETTQLQIWDTAGEKQADLLDSLFWGNAAGAVIVCNLLQANCLNALTFWQDKLHQARSQGLLNCIQLACPVTSTLLKAKRQRCEQIIRHASFVACHLQDSPSLPIVVVGVKHSHSGASAQTGNFEARMASCMTYIFQCYL